MNPRNKRIEGALGCLLSALALLPAGGCKREGAAAELKRKPAPLPVYVGKSTERAVPISVTAIGTVRAFVSVSLKSQVAGVVQERKFTVGAPVKKGQLMFVIDPRPFETALHVAQAKLAQDQAKTVQDQAVAGNARSESDRDAKLLKRGAATQFDADKAESVARAAEAAVVADKGLVQGDQAQVEKAKLDLGYTQIRSPIDGYAGPAVTDVGNVVKENDTTLITVNQIEPIYVDCSVPERYLPAVRRAMEAGDVTLDVSVPHDGGPHEQAKLQLIDNAVDETTGTIRVRAGAPNKDHALWPGQFVNVSIVLGERKDAVLVPTAAVQNGQKGNFVWLAGQDGKAELRPVQVGDEVGGQTVITSGLKAGLTVVTEGQLRLTPGAELQVLGSDRSAATSGPAGEGP